MHALSACRGCIRGFSGRTETRATWPFSPPMLRDLLTGGQEGPASTRGTACNQSRTGCSACQHALSTYRGCVHRPIGQQRAFSTGRRCSRRVAAGLALPQEHRRPDVRPVDGAAVGHTLEVIARWPLLQGVHKRSQVRVLREPSLHLRRVLLFGGGRPRERAYQPFCPSWPGIPATRFQRRRPLCSWCSCRRCPAGHIGAAARALGSFGDTPRTPRTPATAGLALLTVSTAFWAPTFFGHR